MSSAQETPAEQVGLPYWMDQVIGEHAKIGEDLPAGPVHDLRVALRRCILIAETMRKVDPLCDWQAMRKSARRIFRGLGGLRDTQVLADWIARLGADGQASTETLRTALEKRRESDHGKACAALRKFDRKQWRSWRTKFSRHYRQLRANRQACESLLVEFWQELRDLNRRAQRSRSLAAYHRLRVGLKKFRYAAENFSPSRYAAWEADLKFTQDLLGEAHDLMLLEQWIVGSEGILENAALADWRAKANRERVARLQQYRAKMSGKESALRVWRDSLPAEKALPAAGLARMAEWARFLTPGFPNARRVAKVGLQLYDGLVNAGLGSRATLFDERKILHAAALLEGAGRAKGAKGYHKHTYRLIRKLSPPPGWTKRELEFVAVIARFHRRALPYPDHAKLCRYDLPLRQALVRLAGILRLANALDGKVHGPVRLHVEASPNSITIRADGFREMQASNAKLNAARRFLEFVFQRPFYIGASSMRSAGPQIVRTVKRVHAA